MNLYMETLPIEESATMGERTNTGSLLSWKRKQDEESSNEHGTSKELWGMNIGETQPRLFTPFPMLKIVSLPGVGSTASFPRLYFPINKDQGTHHESASPVAQPTPPHLLSGNSWAFLPQPLLLSPAITVPLKWLLKFPDKNTKPSIFLQKYKLGKVQTECFRCSRVKLSLFILNQ